jgi:cytochrome oxidase Cu insertion factor (SCO1/SenC/PrrC family)
MSCAFSGRGITLSLGVLALTQIGLAARHQSGAAGSTVDIETAGPQVGDSLPEFSLRDQHGDARSLKSLQGPKGAVIVFFRSADW